MSEVQEFDTSQFEFFENPLECVGKLYSDSKTADVHFTFDSSTNYGTEIRIGAHKNLLAATSDVFGAMLYGELKETGDIRVIDVSDAAFKEFLQYFYQRTVKLTAENIAEVKIIIIIMIFHPFIANTDATVSLHSNNIGYVSRPQIQRHKMCCRLHYIYEANTHQ